MLLGLEDSGSRMERLARSMLVRDRVVPVAEHLERVRAVTLEQASAVARRILTGAATVAAVGPFADDQRDLVRTVDRAAARAGL
jgi:predicted Zn-dependent peptidase